MLLQLRIENLMFPELRKEKLMFLESRMENLVHTDIAASTISVSRVENGEFNAR